jgi:Domain of unknown function (DUF2382)/PRC-barrel domain
MNFSRVSTSDSGYKVEFGDVNIQNFKVYTEPDHFMGRVVDVLRDENQNYYLTVETGSWLSKKELVVPVSQFNLVPTQSRIYLQNLMLEQDGEHRNYRVINHPTHQAQPIIYSQGTELEVAEVPIEVSAPLEASAPLDGSILLEGQNVVQSNRLTHSEVSSSHHPSVQSEPVQPERSLQVSDIGQLSSDQGEIIRLLEERLVIDRHRRKVGEVVVRKEVETQVVEVPIHREKLVVEQLSPERKQLASINLGQHVGVYQTGFEPAGVSPQSSNGAGASQFNLPAIPLAMAQQIINRLMQSPQSSQSRVQIVFENQELQNQYHHWLMEQNYGETARP